MEGIQTFDKKEVFDNDIKPQVDELKKALNRARIPFVFVACVYSDERDTEYIEDVETEEEESDMRDPNLYCDGITPGAMEMKVENDRIKEIIKVLNGCRAVPPVTEIGYDDDELPESVSDLLAGRPEIVFGDEEEDDEESNFFMTPAEQENAQKRAKDKNSFQAFLDERQEDQELAESMGLTEPRFVGHDIFTDGNGENMPEGEATGSIDGVFGSSMNIPDNIGKVDDSNVEEVLRLLETGMLE